MKRLACRKKSRSARQPWAFPPVRKVDREARSIAALHPARPPASFSLALIVDRRVSVSFWAFGHPTECAVEL